MAESLGESVSESIIQYIISNNLHAGDKLPNELELAQFLSVGRSTVREAIKSLVSRNVLEVRQGAGTFVSSKKGIPEDPLGLTFIYDDGEEDSIQLALDLMDIRLMIEPEIASMAAINGTQEQIAKMMEECEKVEEMMRQNMDHTEKDISFHRSIASCSGNLAVKNLVPIISQSVIASIGVTKDILDEDTYAIHREIAEAIQNRDSRGARYAMISHLSLNRREIMKQMNRKK